MPLNQTNKLTWVVETLKRSKMLTFEDLNEKWMENSEMSKGKELPKRTFHRWIYGILDTFGVEIECEKSAPYRYYIVNAEEIQKKTNDVESWLYSTMSVCNSLIESKSVKERIILEDVPSGREYLEPIIEAMKNNRVIDMTYRSYWKDHYVEHVVMPLCVKLFRQRWYLVGRSVKEGKDWTFCLDRIAAMRESGKKFEYPEDFSPKRYFDGCFGIIADKNIEIENVVLKVAASQANYLRDLPMMGGDEQIETERNKDYSIFKLRVRPTFDFEQELLWNREYLEVLEPLWLRQEMANIIENMIGNYKRKNKKGQS